MTQPALFALTDGEHSEVTEGGIIVPADAADCPFRDYDEERKRADVAEYRCAEQLTLRGYSCTVLGGRFKGFDIIADRDDIRAQHVQVKHGFLSSERQQRYRIHNSTRGGILYSANAYDILVFYMWDRDQWLVYSRAELGNRTNTSYVPPELGRVARKSWSGTHGEAIADRQPNNWELFDQLAIANSQESLGVTQQMSDPLPNTQ